jgi:hypothetical protein
MIALVTPFNRGFFITSIGIYGHNPNIQLTTAPFIEIKVGMLTFVAIENPTISREDDNSKDGL